MLFITCFETNSTRARHLAAIKLARVLNEVVEKNDFHSWARLFKFSRRCLIQPKRGGRRRNLATLVKKQLEVEADPPLQHQRHHRHRLPLDSTHYLARRVSAKLEMGDFKGAVRMVCSEETIANITDETMSALREKHPGPYPDSQFPPPLLPNESVSLPEIVEAEVARVIRSFPRGSAGGPDGILPQHLLDLTSASAEQGGKDLLRALTTFTNFVLGGRVPQSVRPVFFGATLISLRKKAGGVFPIAVGQTLRRLVAKCVALQVTHTLGSSFAPRQLGCGVPFGCEAATHAARCYLQDLPLSHLMLKLDFKNAFNTLRRDKMLGSVKEFAPEFFAFINLAYEGPSLLFCENHVLESAEGVQQGDPLGPLLFCLQSSP